MSLPRTLPALLGRAVQLWPDRVAWVFDEHGESLSFADVAMRSDALAEFLADNGMRQGDHVAVMVDNAPAFPLAWLAITKLGAAMVPVNTRYRSYDAAHVLAHSQARVALTTKNYAQLLREVQPETCLEAVISLDSYDFAHSSGALPEVDVAADTVSNIQYTSGTTGAPKGCVLPHAYWTTLVRGLVEGFPNISEDDVILTAQPFHYIDPQWNVALGLAAGAQLVVLDRFHPSTFWSKICDYEVTWFYCLGMMPKLLVHAPAPGRPHRLRSVCASAIPPELHRELETRWGVPWFEAFGMTETGSDIRLEPRDHDECVGTGCLGRAVPGREARIVDDADMPVPTGVPGQLVVRGAGMMTGYFRDPDATEAVFRNGWLHTGDLARMDDRERTYFVGRTKDMIRRSGENITAAEVERVLQLHPAVTMAAVLPEPDDVRGQEVHAVIVASDGHGPMDLPDLIDHCRRRLADFKVPRYWTFVDALPLTASERVAKPELRARLDRDPARRTHDRSAGVVDQVFHSSGRSARPGPTTAV
jgi:carnitine-CoA ligase